LGPHRKNFYRVVSPDLCQAHAQVEEMSCCAVVMPALHDVGSHDALPVDDGAKLAIPRRTHDAVAELLARGVSVPGNQAALNDVLGKAIATVERWKN
jgi:hypothetical protein